MQPGSKFFPAAACAQFQIEPGNIKGNITSLKHLLEQQAPAQDTLLVLPEMWATGFSYPDTESFAAATPHVLELMGKLAAQHGIFLAGSLTNKKVAADLPFNTLYLVGPQGLLGQADKQYLFSHWQEDQHYQPGKGSSPIDSQMGSVGGMVCYDLRFPELARSLAFGGCQILLISAQWPMSRLLHWQTLVRARAIENQVFVVASNACGTSGKMQMAGHSLIVAPDGSILAEAEGEEGIVTARLDLQMLKEQRRLFCPPGERPWRFHDTAKISTLEELLPRLAAVRRQGSRIAFTNGCFDLLHAGHVSYLEEARRGADCLVVGLNSDSSVRLQNKGDGRPVNTETDRARVLAALGCVDFVVLFDDPTPLALIKAILPEVLVKGADWPEEQIAGAAEVKAAGGEVRRIELTPGRSTSALIATIKNRVAR
ncbi:MAG: D-glycero-beta-D-manno-heptose 1-phosphate adenylyltransferase [Desulfobulbaceae bacterium]|nr:D-glycero-beta-D-manno-heptose 1-phosphate adenylyltransferase [Desulfobulbaceae bacterium]